MSVTATVSTCVASITHKLSTTANSCDLLGRDVAVCGINTAILLEGEDDF